MKSREPERLLSVKRAQQILGSYSKAEIYRMLYDGELRGFWQQRGVRRHWSIPISSLTEFIERLHSNQTDIGGGLEDHRSSSLYSSSGKAAPFLSPHEQVHPTSGSRIHDFGAAPRGIKEEL